MMVQTSRNILHGNGRKLAARYRKVTRTCIRGLEPQEKPSTMLDKYHTTTKHFFLIKSWRRLEMKLTQSTKETGVTG